MKLPKDTKIYVGGACYEGSIPDKVALKLGLLKKKPVKKDESK